MTPDKTLEAPAPRPTRRSEPLSYARLAGCACAYVALSLVSISWEGRLNAFALSGPASWPTFDDGDRAFADLGAFGFTVVGAPLVVARHTLPRPGELVVLSSPSDALTLVKRVIGVGGDRIAMREGVLIRNGRAVTSTHARSCPTADEPDVTCRDENLGDRAYEVASSSESPRIDLDEVIVPNGHVFVLGDRRDRSNDSRNPQFGPVPLDRVLGRVWLRVSLGSGLPKIERIH